MLTVLQKRKFMVFFKRKPFFIVLILFLLCACNVIRGSGNVVTETRTVSGFDKVSLTGSMELFLTQGEQESLEIEGEDNIIAVIETEVRGDTLHIGVKENTTTNPTEPVRVYLTMTEIAGLEISGASSISAESIVSDRLTLDVNGSGSVNIDSLSAASLVVDISGSGIVEVSGQAAEQVIIIGGSGEYQAADLESEVVDVNVSGAGETTVWVNQSLSAEISGSGSVDYYGSPTVSQNVSGSGEVNGLGTR
jgi:hypothetical protein